MNIRPNILPADSLSQVLFVHNYFQLVFQHSGFSIYNAATLCSYGVSFRQGQPGFCDRLVGLIGQTLLAADVSDDSSLVLTFQDGSALSAGSAGLGPEAWQYNSLGCSTVVAQNA